MRCRAAPGSRANDENVIAAELYRGRDSPPGIQHKWARAGLDLLGEATYLAIKPEMPPPPDARQDQLLRHSPDVVSSRLGEAGVLVNLRTNRILELNVTGIRIWELIGDGQTVSGIGRLLQQEFDVTAEDLQREVSRLVAALVREGLVDASDGQ